MRKVTKDITNALLAGKSRKVSNTEVLSFGGQSRVTLQGNEIALYNRGEQTLYITLAGWNTPTKRERVNGILNALQLPYGFGQIKYMPYFYDYRANGKSSLSRIEKKIASSDIIFIDIKTNKFESLPLRPLRLGGSFVIDKVEVRHA